MLGCCWIGSISDVIQAAVAVAALYVTCKGGSKAYQQWKNERLAQRSEFFKTLIDKFDNDYVHREVSLADDPIEVKTKLNALFSDKQKEHEIQSSLRLFSYLCYLKDNELIEAREFGMFENTLKRILSNEKAQEYIRATMIRLGDNEVHPFQSLLDYAARIRIDINAVNSGIDEGDGVIQSTVDNPTERSIVEENRMKPPLTAGELSKHPVAVIRINRLYRQNMKPEELYAVTRGWWRVNPDTANKAKYVLSVAEGHVKEVYAPKGAWQKYESTGKTENDVTDGRYRFDGDVADVSIRRLYLGRSIQGVFRQGDAYPVRYFGVND